MWGQTLSCFVSLPGIWLCGTGDLTYYCQANGSTFFHLRNDGTWLKLSVTCRVFPSREWVESQIPEFVKVGILKVGDAANDNDDFDPEALVKAYVNIVVGACISLGILPICHIYWSSCSIVNFRVFIYLCQVANLWKWTIL